MQYSQARPRLLAVALSLAPGVALALVLAGCGARSSASGVQLADVGPGAPDVPIRGDLLVMPPDQGFPDRPPPDLPPPGWQEITVGTPGVIEDIRGVSDTALWMAGHLPAVAKGTCWLLDAGGFRAETLPTPFPVHGVWGRAASDLWAAGRRDHPKDASLWHRDASGTWTAERLVSPPAMDLLAIDGAANGEFFAVGRAGNIGVAVHRSAAGSWSAQLFSDAFQWIEARDVMMLGPGEAYAVGQRSSRARFWFFESGVWLLDEGLPGVAQSIGASSGDGGSPAIYAGGTTLWSRDAESNWLPVDGFPSKQVGIIARVRGNALGLWLIDADRLWGRRTADGASWRSLALPDDERPRTLWVSPSWIWVAAQSGRVYRHHVLSF